MSIEGIDHVALAVADVARSVRCYREMLLLERLHEEVWGDLPEQEIEITTYDL